MLATLVLAFFLFRNKKSWQNTFFYISASVAILTTTLMMVFSFTSGIYNPEWYAPFHICNLFVIILPLMAIFKNKVRNFLSDYTFYFGILGCIFAVCMPATTQLYFKPFDFISVLVWLYHINIGVAGVYLLASKLYFPKISSLWRLLIIFIPLVIIAFVFNSVWGTNFVFMNPDKFYYPLDVFASIFGQNFTYIIASSIVFVATILMIISVITLKIKSKLVREVIANTPLIKFIKQKNIWEMIYKSDFVNQLKNNKIIMQKVNSFFNYVEHSNFKKCYDAVSFELKNLTVEQFEDIRFINNLIKKSKIISVVLHDIKLKDVKAFFKGFALIPAGEFLKFVKNYYKKYYSKNSCFKALPIEA